MIRPFITETDLDNWKNEALTQYDGKHYLFIANIFGRSVGCLVGDYKSYEHDKMYVNGTNGGYSVSLIIGNNNLWRTHAYKAIVIGDTNLVEVGGGDAQCIVSGKNNTIYADGGGAKIIANSISDQEKLKATGGSAIVCSFQEINYGQFERLEDYNRDVILTELAEGWLTPPLPYSADPIKNKMTLPRPRRTKSGKSRLLSAKEISEKLYPSSNHVVYY